MRVPFQALAIFALISATGCGSGKPDSKLGAKTAALPPPATADAAVMAVTKSLSEDKPESIWQALPASYQKDGNDLIAAFAKSCDPDIYNRSFGIAKKLVLVLQKKKDLIISHPMLAQTGINSQSLAQNWDGVVNVVSLVVNSELSDLNKVKTLDVEKFLAVTGSQLMKSAQELAKLAPNAKVDMQASIASVKATLVKTEGDTATVKMEVAGEAPQETLFKQVEGRWIPKEMADEWKAGVARAKANLEKSAASSKVENRELTLSQFKMVDGVLDQLLAAKTAEEFNNTVLLGMPMVAGLLGPLTQLGAPASGKHAHDEGAPEGK